MNPFDVMYAQATGSGGGGGGGGGVKNYMTSELEVGTLDATGVETDNPNRLRTVDFIELESGTYTVYNTSNLSVIAFRYTIDGTFIDRSGGGFFERVPMTFTVSETQKFRFAFNTGTGSVQLSPEDMKNLLLLKA